MRQNRFLSWIRKRFFRFGWALFLIDCATSDPGGVHARFAWSEAHGLRVVEVPSGPAAAAGLQANDRVLSINNEPIATQNARQVVELLRGPVGSKVTLEVKRGSKVLNLQIARVPYGTRL